MNSFFLPTDHPLINALTCCANCNKEAEPFQLRMCTACRSVCYCDVACQKAHRKYHKHQCKQDAQLLKEAAADTDVATTVHDRKENKTDGDDELFQPIPPQDDCPICALPLPIVRDRSAYSACCGNLICKGCYEKNTRVTAGRGKFPCCAFCREPDPASDKELVVRMKKRMEMNDSIVISIASQYYKFGEYGLPMDPQKAFELCLRAAELGNSNACISAAGYYKDGVVVPKDMAKVREYFEKSAKKGGMQARFNLGVDEVIQKNFRLASRHWLISAAAGCTKSLAELSKSYKFEVVTKQEYSTTLASYRKIHTDEWSIDREAAATRVG